MKTIFWILFILIVYCYFGYPILLSVFASCRTRKVIKQEIFPTISVVISVANEESVIEKKMSNLLSMDYPSDKLEILIGSDGSTDKTNDIVRNFNDKRIQLIVSSQRKGKMATVNQLVQLAQNEMIVFTDARQMFDRVAFKELVFNFADPHVGCVSGELIFTKKEGSTAQGINLYWEYEKFMRQKESQLHSMIGATGAIYAIRRKLFVPAPTNMILDDVFTPLKIVQQGYRAIFEGQAIAYDEAANNPKEEYARKARTLAGNYQIFFVLPDIFNPLKSPLAIQMFSHKLLRVLIPFFLIFLLIINFKLRNNQFFIFILWGQILFYGMAILGSLAKKPKYAILKPISKMCYIPYVFCLLNFSALAGFWRFVRSSQTVTWEKART